MNDPTAHKTLITTYRLQSAIWPAGARIETPARLCYRATPRWRWVADGGEGIRALPGGGAQVEFNTFFGAFSLTTWCGAAGLDDVIVEVVFSGHCTLKIYEDNGHEPARLLHERRVQSDGEAQQVIIAGLRGRRGILYPVLEVYPGDTLELRGVHYLTTTAPRHAPRLAIVMPTFKREEYARRNVQHIADEVLTDGSTKLFVVDNGQSLQLAPRQGVELIPNRNYGGSGGFARGVLAVRDAGGFSHVLFCDDDIRVDPESICRMRTLLRYLPQDVAVSGGMLKMGDRTVLHEKNANVRSMLFTGNRVNQDLAKAELVARYDEGNAQTFNGWWFVCYPLGAKGCDFLPYPFFVGWDDVEMGERLNRLKIPCVSLTGVAVWHDEFEKKDATWRWYYHVRNGLVASMLYDDDAHALRQAILEIMRALLTYRYERAEYMIDGLAAAAQGSAAIRDVSAEKLHQALVSRQQLKLEDARRHVLPEKIGAKRKPSLIRWFFARATMNGHLLPRWMLLRGKAPADPGWLVQELHAHWLNRIFRAPRVVYYEETSGLGMLCEIDHGRYYRGFVRMLWHWLALRLRWSSVRDDWRAAHAEMVSPAFWKRYLER